MSTNIIIIVSVIIAYAGVRYVTRRMTVKRKVVFAGHPSSDDIPNIDISPLPQNDPKYRIGAESVDVSGLEQMVVKGKSLENFGIRDGSIVFVKPIESDRNEELAFLEKLIGRFVVFRIDNARTLKEYPLKNITVVEDGVKLRKAVMILSREDAGTESIIKQFLLDNDKDFACKPEVEQTEEYDRYIKKFRFAASYYREDKYLVMSITYKNGVCKDYSFHSPKWLYGIVEYNTK